MSTIEAPLSVKVSAAAKMLSVSETTVWKLIREDVLKPKRIGRNTLIPYSQLVALVEGGAQT